MRKISHAVAAPATVSGESDAHYATGKPGRPRQTLTRKPGDLPSSIVTDEHAGRGAPVGLSLLAHRDSLAQAGSDIGFVVTCLTPCCREVLMSTLSPLAFRPHPFVLKCLLKSVSLRLGFENAPFPPRPFFWSHRESPKPNRSQQGQPGLPRS
uniref:Uncharacterized protein n=1 Tax=Leptospirillum ferrodiazotrophum TaxID=412449 RepID=C6HXX9_9BACT|nr:MAG: hypothetical protein UBAL3_93200093a [Leptospirillum ferrodiazotrophum]